MTLCTSKAAVTETQLLRLLQLEPGKHHSNLNVEMTLHIIYSTILTSEKMGLNWQLVFTGSYLHTHFVTKNLVSNGASVNSIMQIQFRAKI